MIEPDITADDLREAAEAPKGLYDIPKILRDAANRIEYLERELEKCSKQPD